LRIGRLLQSENRGNGDLGALAQPAGLNLTVWRAESVPRWPQPGHYQIIQTNTPSTKNPATTKATQHRSNKCMMKAALFQNSFEHGDKSFSFVYANGPWNYGAATSEPIRRLASAHKNGSEHLAIRLDAGAVRSAPRGTPLFGALVASDDCAM
jgi:hypothetical protein